MTVIGFALLYLGAANAFLAMNLGTCTQNAADELGGGVLSLGLYLTSVICLNFARPIRIAYLAILPLVLPFWWQVSFSIRFAYGYLVKDMSACEVLHNLPYELDGREAFFTGLWTASCLVLLLGLPIAFYRARSL